MIDWKRVAKVQRAYWLACEQELREANDELRRFTLSTLHPDNPTPQTYEAAMQAYDGACRALRQALHELAKCKKEDIWKD